MQAMTNERVDFVGSAFVFSHISASSPVYKKNAFAVNADK